MRLNSSRGSALSERKDSHVSCQIGVVGNMQCFGRLGVVTPLVAGGCWTLR
jgi:hypothetical protein